MNTILYISAYQYSGTTLASFLLNSHPDIVTVGHTMGWPYKTDEEFLCSCGKTLDSCLFWQNIAQRFSRENIPFSFNDFGTKFQLAENDWLNRKLLERIPFFNSTAFELIRDHFVNLIPFFRTRIEKQRKANKIFVEEALEYTDAKVFVDNSHNPFRLRQLARIEKFIVKNMHLVRDPRGVALSNLKNKNWSVELSTNLWLTQQENIVRISDREADYVLVYYEELCENTDETLKAIYEFLGLPAKIFDGNFKQTEHHILGNTMRFGSGKISGKEKWRTELTKKQQSSVFTIIDKYMEKNRNPVLVEILEHYMERK